MNAEQDSKADIAHKAYNLAKEKEWSMELRRDYFERQLALDEAEVAILWANYRKLEAEAEAES